MNTKHLVYVSVDGNDCTKASAQSCGECIQVGEKCGWCTYEVSNITSEI